MKNLRIIGFLAILGLAACSEVETEVAQNEKIDSHPNAIDQITADPAPGRIGPYKVCITDYEVEKSELVGKMYVPVLDDRNCSVHEKYNLVIIVHADGESGFNASNAHLAYEDLAEHLVSNAFVVVSINRNGIGADGPFDQLLEDHLDYLYNDSDIKNVITNHVGLIGHSAGGRAVIRHAGIINDFGKNLNALITLAPTVDFNQSYSFSGEANAYMGMHVTYDSDVAAFGSKSDGNIMQSTFKIYDDAGLIPGSPNMLSLTKDMIFVNGSGHFFQNEHFSLTYINAFLQYHLNGHGIFNRFFINQEKPPTLTSQVYIQHADPKRLVLADFENNDNDQFNTLGGKLSLSGIGITDWDVGHAYVLDDFSPHNTQALVFDWKLGAQLGTPDEGEVALGFPSNWNLSDYRFLSFRITQVYEPEENSDGIDRNFKVRIETLGGDGDMEISSNGGLLHFPIKMPAPFGVSQDEQTKNAMRSYLLKLNNFEGIDIKRVQRVVFDFSESGSMGTRFMLDDVEFYQ